MQELNVSMCQFERNQHKHITLFDEVVNYLELSINQACLEAWEIIMKINDILLEETTNIYRKIPNFSSNCKLGQNVTK